MIFVCKSHVIDGLKLFEYPHLQKTFLKINKKCNFCNQSPEFKLFIAPVKKGLTNSYQKVV